MCLNNFRKNQRNKTKISSKKCNSLLKDDRLSRSKEQHEGATLRITKKNFQDKELPHELFLTTKQTTKIRNAFTNNMLTDVKLSKAQMSRIILSSSWLSNVSKKALTNGRKYSRVDQVKFAEDSF